MDAVATTSAADRFSRPYRTAMARLAADLKSGKAKALGAEAQISIAYHALLDVIAAIDAAPHKTVNRKRAARA